MSLVGPSEERCRARLVEGLPGSYAKRLHLPGCTSSYQALRRSCQAHRGPCQAHRGSYQAGSWYNQAYRRSYQALRILDEAMQLESLTRVPRGSNKALIWSYQAHRWSYYPGSYYPGSCHVLKRCYRGS